MTNKKPSHVSITKVKQFQGSSTFVKRSQWTMEQLRQVNGIDSNKVSVVSSPCRPRRPHPPPPSCLTQSLALSSRTVRSSTCCLKTPSTSGLPVRRGRSAPSSRSSTTPVSATARHGSRSSSTASPSCWEVRRLTMLTLSTAAVAAAASAR